MNDDKFLFVVAGSLAGWLAHGAFVDQLPAPTAPRCSEVGAAAWGASSQLSERMRVTERRVEALERQ